VIVLVDAFFALVWAGATFLIDSVQRRRHHRPDLTERPGPFVPSVADKAHEWLDRQ
jgi:hypothetical protein